MLFNIKNLELKQFSIRVKNLQILLLIQILLSDILYYIYLIIHIECNGDDNIHTWPLDQNCLPLTCLINYVSL